MGVGWQGHASLAPLFRSATAWFFVLPMFVIKQSSAVALKRIMLFLLLRKLILLTEVRIHELPLFYYMTTGFK